MMVDGKKEYCYTSVYEGDICSFSEWPLVVHEVCLSRFGAAVMSTKVMADLIIMVTLSTFLLFFKVSRWSLAISFVALDVELKSRSIRQAERR